MLTIAARAGEITHDATSTPNPVSKFQFKQFPPTAVIVVP